MVLLCALNLYNCTFNNHNKELLAYPSKRFCLNLEEFCFYLEEFFLNLKAIFKQGLYSSSSQLRGLVIEMVFQFKLILKVFI